MGPGIRRKARTGAHYWRTLLHGTTLRHSVGGHRIAHPRAGLEALKGEALYAVEHQVLAGLFTHGPLRARELAHLLGVPRATVVGALGTLRRMGVVAGECTPPTWHLVLLASQLLALGAEFALERTSPAPPR